MRQCDLPEDTENEIRSRERPQKVLYHYTMMRRSGADFDLRAGADTSCPQRILTRSDSCPRRAKSEVHNAIGMMMRSSWTLDDVASSNDVIQSRGLVWLI